MKTFRKIISIPLYLIGFWSISMIAFSYYSALYFPQATNGEDPLYASIFFFVIAFLLILLATVFHHKENKILNFGRSFFLSTAYASIRFIMYISSYYVLIGLFLIIGVLLLGLSLSLSLIFHLKLQSIKEVGLTIEGEKLQ